MSPVSLKDARKRLGDLVRAAQRGESVVITRRGRKVAQLVAVRSPRGGGLPDLADLRASVRIRGASLSETVVAMRAEERR
ncbi:MAG: type II toxin-antitoxin system prevent-host-death family antitoxin [Planctomycetes bacterium]|nr:type II toxin-antitoxin system prevent-host-death family antitoxin [Planctomycetota bacterium]